MSQSYLYCSRRVGDRVKRRYLGRLSEPSVELLSRYRRLNRVSRKEAVSNRQAEAEVSKRTEAAVKRLAGLLSHLPIIVGCMDRIAADGDHDRAGSPQPAQNDLLPLSLEKAEMTLPSRQEFQRLCRAADAGDTDAHDQLEQLLDQVPHIVAEMTDLVSATRQQVLASIAGDSATSRLAASRAIDQAVDAMMAEVDGDVIGKMYAEIGAISWMDAVRCTAASARDAANHHAGRFWAGQADRATRRFERVIEAYRTHKSTQQTTDAPAGTPESSQASGPSS